MKRSARWYISWSALAGTMMFCGIIWIVFQYGKDHPWGGYETSPNRIWQQTEADFNRRDREVSSSTHMQSDRLLGEVDFSQIESTLSAMTHSQLMDQRTQKLITSWASAHPNDAKKWVMEIANAQLRQPLAQFVALGIAKTNPHAAAMFVANDFLPGNQQDESLVAVVSEWSKRDPNLVAQWLLEFPHDTMGGNAITSLISTWAEQDSQAAGDWLSSLPPGSFRNTGLVAYINSLRRFDEGRAEEFVKLIDLGH